MEIYFFNYFTIMIFVTEAYSQPSQASRMDLSAKKVNGISPLKLISQYI